MIIWLIGLSGSGKTSVGKILYNKLSKSKPYVFVDGDQVRQMWGDNLGYEIEDREKNAIRISKLCKFLDQQNINVVAAVLSNFPKWQSWNRNNFTSYKEIFLDTPIELLKKRDGIHRILLPLSFMFLMIVDSYFFIFTLTTTYIFLFAIYSRYESE